MAVMASWIEYFARSDTFNLAAISAAAGVTILLRWKYDPHGGAQAVGNKDITRALASRKTSGLGLQDHLTTRYKKPSARTALSSKARQMVRLSCKGLPQEYWASQQPACQALSQKRRICLSFRIFPESGGEVRTF